MISRVWRGWTTRDNADAYEAFLRTHLLGGVRLRGIAGYRGGYVDRREDAEEVEWVSTLLFDSLDAVREFAGDSYEAAVVPPEAERLLSRWDGAARHFEVVLPPARPGRDS